VDVCFSEFLDGGRADPVADPGTARDPANYSFVTPAGAQVTAAGAGAADGKSVRLNSHRPCAGHTFTLKVVK